MPPTHPSDSAAGDSQHRVPLRRRGQAAPSASSAAADEALRHLIDHRRRRNRTVAASRHRPSLPARLAGLRQRGIHTLDRSGITRWAPRVLAGAACAGLLATAAFLLIPKSTRLHGVEGSVRLEDEPLPHCILEFQLQDSASAGRAFRTVIHPDADGTFRRAAAFGLPAGSYAVAVKPRSPSPRSPKAAIPASYTQFASTPLRIEIRRPTEVLDLVITQ